MAAGAVIGALRVNLGLDSAQFQNGLKQSQSGMQNFARAAAVGFAAVAAAGAAAFMAVQGAAQRSANVWREANIANAGIEEFQRLAHGAKMVGVEAQKLSDIYKDVNDKVGDFLQTGGGPMADFFENIAPQVGITADEFARLSGPEALQAYYNALEKAGLSQSEMTFYMEAIASDATALIPLLRNGGAAFSELGDEAERLGLVLGEDTVAMGMRFNENMARITGAATGLANAFGTMLLPAAVAITNAIIAMTPAAGDFINVLGQVAQYTGVAIAALAGFYAPAVLAGIATLNAAIGAGLVGAIRAVTVAMMANPLGLLIGAISAAVAAAFLFRDDIVRIFGVDIVGAAANVANKIIGAFVGAYEAVKASWGSLPAFFSGLGKKAYNSLLESFSGPALTIETPFGSWESGGFNLTGGSLALTNEEAQAFERSSAAFDQSYNRDYIGDWTGAIESAGNTSASTLAQINSLANGLGGAGGSGGLADAAGGAAKALKEADEELDSFGVTADQITNTLASGFTNMFMSAIDGSKSLMASIGDLLKSLGSMFLNAGFQALFSMGGGGLFSGVGNFFSGLFGGARASGGPVSSGKAYLVGERGPELFTPGSNGNITANHKLGDRRPTTINLMVQEGSMFEATVRRISGEGDVRVVKSIERGLPGMMQEAQMRQG